LKVKSKIIGGGGGKREWSPSGESKESVVNEQRPSERRILVEDDTSARKVGKVVRRALIRKRGPSVTAILLSMAKRYFWAFGGVKTMG